MEEELLINKIFRILFYIYFVISIGLGLLVCIWNLQMSTALKNDLDPNPGVAMYYFIIYPMIIALVVSAIVSVYQYARYIKTFKISLIPLIIWLLTFILL